LRAVALLDSHKTLSPVNGFYSELRSCVTALLAEVKADILFYDFLGFLVKLHGVLSLEYAIKK
jgi:hypothetical protein